MGNKVSNIKVKRNSISKNSNIKYLHGEIIKIINLQSKPKGL